MPGKHFTEDLPTTSPASIHPSNKSIAVYNIYASHHIQFNIIVCMRISTTLSIYDYFLYVLKWRRVNYRYLL